MSGYSVSSDKLMDYFVNFVTEKKANSLKKAVAHRGDIIVTHRGTLGQISVIPQYSRYSKYVISQSQFRLKVKEEKADPYFIVLFFHSEKGQRYLLEGKGHTGVPALAQPTTTFRKLYVPLPSIPEQHLITSALSDIDTLVASLENLIEKKKEIKQGAMQELLTGKKRLPGFDGEWTEYSLNQLLEYEQPIMYIVKSDLYFESGIPVLTAGKTILLGYTHECDGIYEKGDVIIFDDFTTASKYITYKFKVKSSAMKLLTARQSNINLKFIFETMQLIDFKLNDHQRYWISEYSKIRILLPPTLEEQNAITDIISDMDGEIEVLTQKLEKCRQIKQGMMQELLTGRIRLVDTASKKQRKEKKVLRTKPTVQPREHNKHFREAVILSAVVSIFASEKYPLGRFRRQKLAYLLHRHAQESTQGFLKKAAGPYNPTIRYKDEKIALKAGYVAERGNGKFVKGEKTNEAVNYFTQWYGTEAIEWLKQFQFRKNDELEVLTTVAEAIADLKRNSLTIAVESIKQVIQSNPEWRPKLDKTYFNDINIKSAMIKSQKLFA